MPKIAISYRRTDTDATGRIYDRLVQRYGRETIFRDIDRIRFGVDFRKAVNEALNDTDILLAIVGPNWRGVTDDGSIRIQEANDIVRIEVETALKRDIPVIPVLISNTVMPKPTELPETLTEFSFRNAASIDSGRNFDHDIERLMRSMDGIIEEKEKLVAEQKTRAKQEQADSEKKRAEEEQGRKERELLEQKQQREQKERERKAREVETKTKFDKQNRADTLRWKLVFFPWLPVRSLQQARFLTLAGTASLGVIAAFSICMSIIALYKTFVGSLTTGDWIGLTIYFVCCAYWTFENSRVAACLGLFGIVSYFGFSFGGEFFPRILISSIGFIVTWIIFSGVKGTFATARLQRKSNET
jgi:hypothetical protein